MVFVVGLLLILASMAAGQSISPSNSTLPTPAEQLDLVINVGSMITTAGIAPLTPEIGLGATKPGIELTSISGTFKSATPQSAGSFGGGDIAYLCCDPNADSSNLDPSNILRMVAGVKPKAIVLYSLVSDHCDISGDTSSYSSILTMMNALDAKAIKNTVRDGSDALIIPDSGRSGANPASQGTSAQNDKVVPTTAVAMSILYSITGVITVLFLIIIATGAWRAHRHPERYGPRPGIPGRSRQSRAKGLARAMLETLPIVKFGDPQPVKPANRDIELESATEEANRKATTSSTEEQNSQTQEFTAEMTGSREGPSNLSQDHSRTETSSEHGQVTGEGSELTCSVCTEDFMKGEDVRVLPCNHKYHPACIDPWLLNVSGTCPLCRVNLQPVTSPVTSEGAVSESDPAPPLNGTEVDHSHPRLQRILNLRHAPAHERVAALRELRNESPSPADQPSTSANDIEERTRRAGLSARLRETFRIRTRRAAPPEEVARATATVVTPESADQAAPAGGSETNPSRT